MHLELNIDLYKKYNNDLIHLTSNELTEHYNKIGKYQMRLYFEPSLFKKEKVYIFTTKFGYYLSNVLRYILFKNFIISHLIEHIDIHNKSLHIIPFSQKVKQFPKNYIIYQLEQKDISKWIDKKYELSILYSKETWDYSKSNIEKFSTILQKKIKYVPISIIPINYWNMFINLDIIPQNNILFYGSMNVIREEKLNYLQQKLAPKYYIKIVKDKFGSDLFNEILNSKIILNIHFYENAILETYRLNEALSCGKIIISEKPNQIDDYNYQLYNEKKVIFINNMDSMVEQIIYILDNNVLPSKDIKMETFDVNLNFSNLI